LHYFHGFFALTFFFDGNSMQTSQQLEILQMSSVRIALLAIDPQRDFMDYPDSALAVPGALADTARLTAMIKRLGGRLDDITVTLDSHHLMHIANPMMWRNSQGERPKPFTQITVDDVANGVWRSFNPRLDKLQRNYVETLAKNGRYILMIWPPHCIIGTEGGTVQADLSKAILEWEDRENAIASFVTKGSNYATEHYSALQAEVVDPNDVTTSLNVGLIQTLQQFDIVLLAGQALSHCVANTVRDIIDNFGAANIEKLHLLRDCTSSVPGCEKMGTDFLAEATGKGMKVVDSTTFLL